MRRTVFILAALTLVGGPVAAQTDSGSGSTSWSGTSTEIGSITFHNLSSSDGESVSGSSQQIGPSTFHSFSGSDGTSTDSVNN